MVILSIAIVIALLITIGLPIAAGFWLNKKLNLPWLVISYGALGYFIIQALITLLLNGLSALVQNGTLVLPDQSFITLQITVSVLLATLLGVLIRWAAMKYLKERLDTLEAGYGLGVGYGGAESIMLVGLPLLTTFITMLSNYNIDPQTTTLDPVIANQLVQLWQIPAHIPLAGSLERIAAFVMHITVTILIYQVFKRKQIIWLGAAFLVELIVTGLIVILAELNVMYGWVVLAAFLMMIGNLFILYRLNAYDFKVANFDQESEIAE